MRNCNCGINAKIIDKRDRGNNRNIRRYECPICKTRFTTIELFVGDGKSGLNVYKQIEKKFSEKTEQENPISSASYIKGVAAYDDGKLLEDNPFGDGDLQSKCLWAAGWVDRNRGMV